VYLTVPADDMQTDTPNLHVRTIDMANTTFSGPVISQNGFVFPATTAAALGAVGDAINTTNKTIGKSVVDLTTGLIYTSTGALAASPWKGSDGTTTVTPA